MNKPSYAIEVRNKMLERWHALEDEYPEDMQWFKDFLKWRPTNTRITNGKVKKLKGDLKKAAAKKKPVKKAAPKKKAAAKKKATPKK